MFKLTKRAVEGLAVETEEYLVWDRDMRGFGLRVNPSGKKTYLVQYRASRWTRRITIGQHGVLTAEEARTQAKQLLGEWRADRTLPPRGRPSGAPRRLRGFVTVS
ncbi:Arm DNA-binding domain-containing protein [uncultured Ruegeria sp.]|uniref:Arm DNA-binding domain-containing protein n=1 Tax=uncultured Ruegeria sp. TaxID=259304 RepID=UPI00260DC86A|nr:Arm DNA-binding domain-containing protein [uncultured Ruegeria sp.]